MPSLEELRQQVQQEKQRRKQQPEPEQPGIMEQMTNPYVQGAKSFNVGLAQMLGLPGTAAQGLRSLMGYDEETALPTGQELQQTLADVGGTYEPGEEPDDLMSRVLENVGASALPIAGMGARALKTGAKIAPWAATELSAAAGGAAGGKYAQATDWGQENPMLARAIGELGGGVLSASPRALGRAGKSLVTKGPPGLRLLKAPMRGEWARRRAIRSLSEQMEDPQGGLEELRRAMKSQEEESLTAAQKTGDPGLAKLRKQVEAEIDKQAKLGREQMSQATSELEAMTRPTAEGAGEVQQQLQSTLQKRAKEAQQALKKARQAEKPEFYNKQARQKIEQAYEETRKQEQQIWSEVPTTGEINPSSLKQTYQEELENITAGGDVKEIDQFVRKKLGQRLNEQGQIKGGEFLNAGKQTATPKELHQFYSKLGRRVRQLAQEPGRTNEIRILNRLRGAVLDDLDKVEAGSKYREAINFSRDLNERFTSGDLGKVLGFERGTGASEAMTLDEIIGQGGQRAKEAVDQVLQASPQAADDIKNTIRSRFAMATVHQDNNRVASQAGKQFLQKHRRLLDAFPDLKQELSEATAKQKRVDTLKGGQQVEELSPVAKQRAAASLFLNQEDPGQAVSEIITGSGQAAKNKTRYLRELKQMVQKDPTGKAPQGLKNAITSELMETSRRTDIADPKTGEALISGRKFLKKLESLQEPLKKSGAMSEKEFNRLKKIGQAFKKVETQAQEAASGQITTDLPGQGLNYLAKWLGATASTYMPGPGGAGVGLQEAQIGSSLGQKLINALTIDEARNLIIKATNDDKIMKNLLKDIDKLSDSKAKEAINILIEEGKQLGSRVSQAAQKAQAPATALTPPMVQAGKYGEQEGRKAELKRRLQNLQ